MHIMIPPYSYLIAVTTPPTQTTNTIVFSTLPSSMSVYESMEATFECAVNQTSEPFIMAWWLTSPGSYRAVLVGMNDERGARIADHAISAGERNLSLTVQNVQAQQNRSSYICRVQGVRVTLQESAMLEVLCKPN